MRRLTRFIDGTGPIFAGKIFPFCFITIACGALSGFHSDFFRDHAENAEQGRQARMVGFTACMLVESFVR